MTEDYRGCAQGSLSRDPPSTNDKDSEGCLSGSPNSTQICKTLGQESSGRFFCITGIRDSSQPREHRGHVVLKTFFQKLMEKAITPHRATSGSVGYDLYTPIDFVIQLREQKTILIDLAVSPPEGYCHGMTESVKVHRKDQSVEDFTSKCLFLLFWPISCNSLISLIEI